MITYNVNPNKKNAYVVSVVLFISCIVCFMFTALDIKYKLLLQLIGIILAVVAVQITLRFISYNFSYLIDDKEPKSIKIYRIQNKKSKLAFGVLFEDVYKIEKVQTKNKSKKQKPEEISSSASIINYCGTLFAPEYYNVYFLDEGKRKCLRLEINEIFANEIEMRIRLFGGTNLEE